MSQAPGKENTWGHCFYGPKQAIHSHGAFITLD